ncbi:MAG: putative transposase, partial [Isosphaeraceae bacterium]
RGASVMTPEVTAQAQQLLGAGQSRKEVAEQLGLKVDTLRKAIQQGRLTELRPLGPGESVPENAPAPPPPTAADKSTRAVEDAAAEMGTACTRPDERVPAAFGVLDGAPTRFETCRDVSFGGVLCALPALAANGLFQHIHDCLPKLRGYYSTLHVIVLLAHMALCRIKTVEQLQYQPPGELGKLLGLDRVPEVRCLRRKLAASGHQVSLISSAFGETARDDSVRLFSQWYQENFFRYMMQHFAIDLLNEYGTEEIPETKRPVVNPKWRELDRQKRSVKSKLTHRQARFAGLTLHPESDEAAVVKWEKRKAELVEEIEQFENELTEINAQLKTTPGHLAWDELPETDKFQRLAPSRKQLVDTVKMIAYRAETALASIVREELARTDDARSLLRDLFGSEADLLPDLEKEILRVQIHPMSNPRSNRAIAHLLEHLNDAEFTYPGTKLRLVYSIAGQAETPNLAPHQNPADQEV